MKLSLFIPEEHIWIGTPCSAQSKREILEGLLTHFRSAIDIKPEDFDYQKVLDALLTREKEMTTGLGDGMAFPHARIDKLKRAYTFIAICKEGIDYSSLDHQPVHFFILSLVPLDRPELLLQIRAAVVRFLSNEENYQHALTANSAQDLWQCLDKSDARMGGNILARDIMRPYIGFVDNDMTIKEAAQALHRYHADSLPILDSFEYFYGDISCHDLFSFGLPKFFNNLKTIGFMRNMDPFEKYFKIHENLSIVARQIDRPAPVINADATLMEVVFEMTTHNKPILYVVEDSKLLGIIDRFSIIDKVLITV